ncbi:hypothetical protein Y032_0258g435 [Ancylostoma ceylanicum]|nr:hypothetical protein Y032_0258g435 [Ancylostoma ceylanicum]
MGMGTPCSISEENERIRVSVGKWVHLGQAVVETTEYGSPMENGLEAFYEGLSSQRSYATLLSSTVLDFISNFDQAQCTQASY